MKIKRKKLKLKSTLREKRHYMIIEVSSFKKLSDSELKNKIESCIKNFIGSLGLASAGPIFVKIIDKTKSRNISISVKSNENLMKTNAKSKNQRISNTYRYKYLILLSVLAKYVDYVKAALVLWREQSMPMKCIGVSGTIKKSQRFMK